MTLSVVLVAWSKVLTEKVACNAEPWLHGKSLNKDANEKYYQNRPVGQVISKHQTAVPSDQRLPEGHLQGCIG